MTICEQLESALKELNRYQEQKDELADKEKRARDDQKFRENVIGLSLNIVKIQKAQQKVQFQTSDEILKDIEDTIETLEACVSDGWIDDEELSKSYYSLRNIDKSLNTEWSSFYEKKKRAETGKLDFILQLTDDKPKFTKIKNKLNTVDKWGSLQIADTKGSTRLDDFSYGMNETDKAMSSLNLNDEIRQFLSKVTNGKATIIDLDDQIIKWIKEQKLEKTFRIRFNGE